MVRIAVCDDSDAFCQSLTKTLHRVCREVFPLTVSYELGDYFKTGEELLLSMEKKDIDVLFLDIDLPGMNGLELARLLNGKYPKTLIIFVSAYDRFVYDVFEFSPFAFLRKEDLHERLPKTMKRLADRLDAENQRIPLQTVEGKKTLFIKDILYIKSCKNYYEVYTESGKACACRGTLKAAAARLLPFDFFQIHSAYLVNLDAVSRIDHKRVFLGESRIELPVSQGRFPDFKKAYAAFTMRNLL